MNHYDTLEVHQGASFEEIKRNYRRLVKIYHPDVNPSALAAEKITQITLAYEVLSDPNARATYDWQISVGASTGYTPPKQEPVVDEREQRRREYVKWRRKRDEELWQKRFHMKVMFYKYQRYFAYLFLAIGLLFTYDHYVSGGQREITVEKVLLDKWGDTRVNFNGTQLLVSGRMYYDYVNTQAEQAIIYRSGLFGMRTKLGFVDQPAYAIRGTLFQFGNAFAFVLILLCAALIYFKDYSDIMLTLGLLPVFIVLFLIAFIVVY